MNMSLFSEVELTRDLRHSSSMSNMSFFFLMLSSFSLSEGDRVAVWKR